MEKEKSTQLLENLYNFTELGYNINKSIESILEYEKDGRIVKSLQKVLEYSVEYGEPIEMLIKEKIVSRIEGTILKYSESPKEAIRTILDNRNKISSLEGALLLTILPIFISSTLLLLLITQTKQPILNFMDGFLVKIMGGSDYKQPDLPLYFDPTIQLVANYILIFYIFVIILLPIWYLYNLFLNEEGLKTINKVFNIRSTFDSLKFIDLMYKMNQTTGLSILQILDILAEEHPSKNIRKMLSEAKSKMDEGANFYETLNDWYFDKQIVNIVEVGERTSNTWKSMEKIPSFAQAKVDGFIKNVKRRISIFKLLTYVFLLFVGLEIMMIVVALQQLIVGAL